MANDFPHEYRLGSATRILMSTIGYLFAVGGIALLVAPFLMETYSGDSPAGMLFAGAVFLLLGMYALAGVRRVRVILHADVIEVHHTFTTKRLARAEIIGRRGNPVRALLLPGKFLPVSLPQEIRTDAKFDAWMAGFTDVNLQEAQASLDTFLKDDAVGGSTEERLAHLNSARRVATFLVWISLAAFFWGVLYPRPYQLVILVLAVLPWVAVFLLATDGTAYRLDRKTHEVTADLTSPLLVPGFALMLRGLLDIEVLDWATVAWLTAAVTIGIVLVMVIFVRDARGLVMAFFILPLLMVSHAFGVVMLANQQFDTSDPERYSAQVLGAHISTDKNTSYYLTLGPWGPRAMAEDVDVGKDYYARGSQRETVCVWLFRGALGARWFVVSDCPAD